MLVKNSKTTKELKGTSRFKQCIYISVWPLVMYSNYFEIVTTVTFLDSQTGLISGTFLFETVILYHNYTL